MEKSLPEEDKYEHNSADYPGELPPVAYSTSRSRRKSRIMAGFQRVLLAALLLVLLAYLPSTRTFSLGDDEDTTGAAHDAGDAKIGAVASESSICSRYGGDMLKIGGNAADAVSRVRVDVLW